MNPQMVPYLMFLEFLALLVRPTLDTCLIRTRRVLKRVMSLPLEAPQSLGGKLNIPYLPLRLTMLKFSPYMKQLGNAFG